MVILVHMVQSIICNIHSIEFFSWSKWRLVYWLFIIFDMFVGGVWLSKDTDIYSLVILIIIDFLVEGITNITTETTKISRVFL